MVRKIIIVGIIGAFLILPFNANAQRGCCSYHGGVIGCDSSGRQICADNTLSPSCTCDVPSSSSASNYSSSSQNTYVAPPVVYGCTDSSAINYNSSATEDDGSCIAKIEGCMDSSAINYNQTANTEDDSCQYQSNIVEKETVKYKTKYEKNNNMTEGEEKITMKGEIGEKEVNYTVITDKDGNIISKEKTSETVTKEPVTEIIQQGTKTEQSGLISVLWIICICIVLIYRSNHKKDNLLINKISNQKKLKKILLYICYFIFILPVFVDTILIIKNKLLKKQTNI